uniref:SAC domain-containing protein n=1 Tax=Heterorhabditis bacteriophora TaxID=37862 RepID=A0A1I7XE57_HETBA
MITGEVVKQQQGILRTNCVDCLDRTNVVQGAISQYVCMQQAQRLGIFGPLSDPPVSLITMLQNMWADNGDAISTQYAGTAALKGDVTRNGERRLAGIMKDGYNSASRYYLSHMRDSARQKAINALLGQPDKGSETMYTSDSDSDEDESVCRLVAETAHFLLPDMEVIVGGWGLSHLQESKDTVNCVVLLTRFRLRTKLYIAEYDGDAENLIDVKTVPLENVKTIEVGRPSRSSRLHIRIVSLHSVHLWTAARTRLFNNVAIRLKTSEEADEYIESIADQIRVAINMSIGKDLRVERPARIQQIGHGSARKALASVAYAFKSIGRGRAHAPAPADYACGLRQPITDCSGTTMSSEDCPPSFKRETTGIHLFHDDMDMYTSNSSPPKLPMSSSDGRLSDRSPVLSNSLKGLRTIAMSEDSTPHPFQALVNLMEHTKTKLILL